MQWSEPWAVLLWIQLCVGWVHPSVILITSTFLRTIEGGMYGEGPIKEKCSRGRAYIGHHGIGRAMLAFCLTHIHFWIIILQYTLSIYNKTQFLPYAACIWRYSYLLYRAIANSTRCHGRNFYDSHNFDRCLWRSWNLALVISACKSCLHLYVSVSLALLYHSWSLVRYTMLLAFLIMIRNRWN